MTAKRLYLLLGLACAAGYLYLFYAASTTGDETGFGPCMFKNATGIPCPSCGSTRSVLLLSKGDLVGSMMLNPLGILLATGLLVVPVWILFDLVARKRSLHEAWLKFETQMKSRKFAAIILGLIALNWIWNIYKNL